tara:strand:- start:296 stop:1129 length:834 start_codon:yes stop_codon:yes gene_type:complete
MKKSTHSKIKNTGILFELLTRQITSDTLTGKKASPALNIIKEFFTAKAVLAKELVLYQTLINESFKTKSKAETLLNTTIKVRRSLNNKKLNEAKYNLIKVIKENYDLKEFFKSSIGNYKIYASIYRVFEGSGIAHLGDVVRSRETITEHIVAGGGESVLEKNNYLNESEEVRMLAYKVLLEKFNEKYAGLSAAQRNVLKEYIYNVSNTTKLRDYVIKESTKLQKNLEAKSEGLEDPITTIKLSEVVSMLDRNKKVKRVNESHVHSLLLYHELLKELS